MNDLLRYVLESGVCLTFLYAVYWIFLKNETYFFLNRFYLLSALILSFIIPGLRVTSPFRSVRVSSGTVGLMPAPDLSVPSLGWADILLTLYAAGVLLFLVRFLFHLVKLWSVIRRCGWRHYRDCKVVSVDREFAPFSFLNFVFLNEGAVSPDDLEKILAHERVHIRQGHSLDVLLMELAITLQWFNPFVWPYKKSLQETHEYLADDGVIAQGFSAVRYKLLVFEQHVGAQLFEFANNFKQSQIKRRLTMMSKIKSGNAARLKLFFLLPMAVFLVLAFAEPRLVRSADPSVVVPVLQEAAHQSQEHVSKEEVAKEEHELQMLMEKERILRDKLRETVDAEAQKELYRHLKEVLVKQQEIYALLEEGGGAPGLPTRTEYKKLQQSELEIRELLSQTNDPEKQAELKMKLEQVMVKQTEIKSMLKADRLKADSANAEATIEDLEKQYQMLDQKAADIRAKLAETQDAQQKAELEDLLKKIAMKQEQIKIEAEKIKAAQEKKRN